MIDDEGVEVVLDGSVVEEGGKLIRLDVGTTGPVYKLGLGVETYNARLLYRACRTGQRLVWEIVSDVSSDLQLHRSCLGVGIVCLSR